MVEKKIAVFPGSFDPFTTGHENIISRSLDLFDEVIISIGAHSQKTCLFSLDKRMAIIQEVYKNEKRVSVDHYKGLTIDYCKKVGARYLLRGLRTSADFEYERAIAQVNRKMNDQIETVFLLTTPELTPVNSTIVREILRHHGDVSQFLPDSINLDDF
ncbi:MAG: pantetheine-phosphate adenylyltransferase [Bacteroidales bacterium]|nr:pantetheine-phosphate adenylyltransferase [Bacteroidales bacterium]